MIALVYAWMLTLVLITLVPVMIFAGFLQLKALTGHAGESKKALEEAGKVQWTVLVLFMVNNSSSLFFLDCY